MPVELIWIAAIVVVGSVILAAALCSEVSDRYRRNYVKPPSRANNRGLNHVAHSN
jgi:hypothetical protein